MTRVQSPQTADRSTGPVERSLEAIRCATMSDWDALSPDVTLDATVPNWRCLAEAVDGRD